jgi:predicted RNA polymerase sigma factor
VEDEVMEEQALPDERPQLVFTYCHPALALEEQVVYPIFGFVDGELVLLEDQNRSLWNQDQIADGRAKFDRAIAPHGRGPMCCRQAIASLQVDDPIDLADTAAATVAATIAGARSRAGRSDGDRSRACAGRLPVSALDPRRLRASAAAGQS